jgi:hypothetical protein
MLAAIRESNVMIIGSDSTVINKAFLGRGQVSAFTGSFSLSIHGKPGSNVNDVIPLTDESAAANIFYIDGSRGTGTGIGGDIIFRVAPAGPSGNSQNALVESLRISAHNRVLVNAAAATYNERMRINGLTLIDGGIINRGVLEEDNIINIGSPTYSITDSDYILNCTVATDLTLPDTTSIRIGKTYLIMGANVNVDIEVFDTGTETIDGGTSYNMTGWSAIFIKYVGSGKFRIY